tara:strand:- start:225 stop:1019 length:795 start_codon:yes stop_codon:yes gene_type:complete
MTVKEKKMKKIMTILSLVGVLAFFSDFVYADDHSQDLSNVANVQVNVCKLNEGVSIEEYNKVTEDYIKWSKRNNVETFYARHFPLFSHGNTNNPLTYDFLELLGSTHEISGEAWDLWLNTKDGQKLNARWQAAANCYPKMATGVNLYSNEEALEKADERVVKWNWCSLNDNISAEEIMMEHAEMAKNFEGNDLGIIGWAALIPRLGGANAPGDFAHILVFSDNKSSMKHQKSIAEGGWRDYRDYEKQYASCRGEELYDVQILNR